MSLDWSCKPESVEELGTNVRDFFIWQTLSVGLNEISEKNINTWMYRLHRLHYAPLGEIFKSHDTTIWEMNDLGRVRYRGDLNNYVMYEDPDSAGGNPCVVTGKVWDAIESHLRTFIGLKTNSNVMTDRQFEAWLNKNAKMASEKFMGRLEDKQYRQQKEVA